MPLLTRHPSGESPVLRVEAWVARKRVRYLLAGDLDRIRIPPPRPPRTAERLWQHTCCELFVRRKGSPQYHEFNFSPSGEWAAYAFARYREGALLRDNAMAPRIAVNRSSAGLELEAHIDLEASVIVGIAAVVEDESGALSYWALRHPPGRPDFHHPDGFALELD